MIPYFLLGVVVGFAGALFLAWLKLLECRSSAFRMWLVEVVLDIERKAKMHEKQSR